MIKTKIVQINKEITEDIICNKCGESCAYLMAETYKVFEHGHLLFDGGYKSKVFGDGVMFELDFCENYLKELLGDLKISPEMTEHRPWHSAHQD